MDLSIVEFGSMKTLQLLENDEMKIAASYAIADTIPEDQLTPDYIIPGVFDESVHENVVKAVMKAARESGVARI